MFSSRDQPFEQKKNRKKRPFQKVDGSSWIHPNNYAFNPNQIYFLNFTGQFALIFIDFTMQFSLIRLYNSFTSRLATSAELG